MRVVGVALLIATAAALPAAAMEAVSKAHAPDIARTIEAAPPSPDQHMELASADDENAIIESEWQPEPGMSPGQSRFKRMQSDELVTRLGFGDGKTPTWARFNLRDSAGNGPTVGGTFDGGTAKLILRWKQK